MPLTNSAASRKDKVSSQGVVDGSFQHRHFAVIARIISEMVASTSADKLETIKVEANNFFLHSNNDLVSDRKTLQIFVSDLLMSVNAYRGFKYLSKTDMPTDGYTFGIERSETGDHKFPDDSRIFFY